jgi:hypothetical protein
MKPQSDFIQHTPTFRYSYLKYPIGWLIKSNWVSFNFKALFSKSLFIEARGTVANLAPEQNKAIF